MELKKYKKKRITPQGWKEITLAEVFNTSSGATPLSTEASYYENGTIPWINSGELASPYIYDTTNFISQAGFENSSTEIYPIDTVLVAMYGATAGKASLLKMEACTNQAICAILPNKDYSSTFLKYSIDTLYDHLVGLSSGSARDNLSQAELKKLKLIMPPTKNEQNKLVSILASIDRKIELNQAINQNLEAMAKQLYDYWFVQFDFPNKDGRPYKSSGGKMVWNKKIKREIPEGWKEVTLNDFIDKNKGGDWGYDTPKDGTIKVGCVRGADIIKLNDVPTRHITSKHSDRLLEDGDIVIEISGGSPVQATGRVALITNGVIERNGGALVCSNFCQSFNMKKREFSEYFYYLWQNLYDNDNMFNFEGKTSGIKNFQTDVFLANYWFEVPEPLIETFHTIVAQYHLMIDQNIIENNNLIKQRDKLLPLLMNGQVSVNSDLSVYKKRRGKVPSLTLNHVSDIQILQC